MQIPGILKTLKVSGFIVLSALVLKAEDRSFDLSLFGIGPITVRASLTYEGEGERLIATAKNDSGTSIEHAKICIRSFEAYGCLFEVSNTALWAPGVELNWNLSTAKKLPALRFYATLEQLNVAAPTSAAPVAAPARSFVRTPVPVPTTVAAPAVAIPDGLVTSVADPAMLTDSEVSAAIIKASLNGRHRIGLMLNDEQTAWASVLVPGGVVSGYTIFVYSPEQWIEQQAVNAKREMLPFTLADVTPDMRRKMLHVVAMPSTPEYLNGTGFALSSSVHRIVITDSSRNVIVQPVQLSNGSVVTNSALRSAEFSNANAAFMMSDVDRLRASDGKSEFFIVVTGSNQKKFFRVKERFFKTLFN